MKKDLFYFATIIIVACYLAILTIKVTKIKSDFAELSKNIISTQPITSLKLRDKNKEEKYEILNNLSVEVQIYYFDNFLGKPIFVNHLEKEEYAGDGKKEYIFVDSDFYVQAITNANDKVLSYAITSRKKDFNPTFGIPGPGFFSVSLNKTKFSEWSTGETVLGCYRYLGAHDPLLYFEGDYFGNPGYYLNYYVGINNCAYPYEEIPGLKSDFYDEGFISCDDISEKDRAELSPNTFIVHGMSFDTGKFEDRNGPGVNFGPSSVQLRLLRL